MHLDKLLIVVVVIVGSAVLSSAGPFHAQCKLQWFFSVPCHEVMEGLVMQIKKWSSTSSCATGGQKCLYKLQAASLLFISAKHTTPLGGHVEDMTFRLAPYWLYSRCQVSAMSVSESWLALYDHGRNYCNLFNLAEGSGLTGVRGFKEITSDFLCTQRSSANCTVY